MRYEPDHKERTHRRIVKRAARRFRAEGLSGPAIASLMKASGLTVGGFYKHFRSKDDLLAEAIEEGFSDFSGEEIVALQQVPPGERWKEVVRRYLSLKHCDHPESGCPVAALAPEIARAAPAVRRPVAGVLTAFRTRLMRFMLGHTVVEGERSFKLIC